MIDIHRFEPLFGDWYIDGPIGAGSYGTVYRAHQNTSNGRLVSAIKHISIPQDDSDLLTLSEDLGTEDPKIIKDYIWQLVKQELTEFDLAHRFLGSPNIVQYYENCVIEKKEMPGFDIFIRMELLNSVNTRISYQNVNENEVRQLAIDVCSALQLLHQQNLVHRDIKPQNILVSNDGIYKVADFGEARYFQGLGTFMTIRGTLDYIAPEVLKYEKSNHKADIYSLGIVLYRLMNNGVFPLVSNNDSNAVLAYSKRMQGCTFPAPCNASKQFAEIILKACAYKPEDRWESASAMKAQLEGKFISDPPKEKIQEHNRFSLIELRHVLKTIQKLENALTQEQAKLNGYKPTVFISYNHSSASEFVNYVEDNIKQIAIVYRDERQDYWSNLSEFMQSIGEKDFAILVITEQYLQSVACMKEAIALMSVADWQNKVLFAVLDPNIYQNKVCFLRFWDSRLRSIQQRLDSGEVGPAEAESIQKEKKTVLSIHSKLNEFLDVLSDKKNPPIYAIQDAILRRIEKFSDKVQ